MSKANVPITVLAAASLAAAFAAQAKADDALVVGTHVWPGFMPTWIIEERELGEQAGGNVDIQEFRRVVDSMTAFTAGTIEGNAMILADAIIPASQGIPLKIILISDESSGADGILAKHEVQNLADFKGRRVGYEFGGVSQLLLIKALESAGLEIGDVNSVNMSSFDAGTAFVAGALDVAVTWEPFLTQGTESGHGRVVFDSSETPGLIPDIITFRQSALDERTEDVYRFVEAWRDALALIETEEDVAFDIMAAGAGISRDEMKVQYQGIKPYSVAEVCEELRNKDSAFYANARVQAEFLLENGFIETIPNIDEIADHRFACAAAGEFPVEQLLSK